MDNTSQAYPMAGIVYPGRHDLLLGRGGETNNHSGNIKFRNLIVSFKEEYRAATRREKPMVAAKVVTIWRSLDPPGRFLKRTDPSSTNSDWYDIGDAASRRRTSKALGEKDDYSITANATSPPTSEGRKRPREPAAVSTTASSAATSANSGAANESASSSARGRVGRDAIESRPVSDQTLSISTNIEDPVLPQLRQPPRHTEQYQNAAQRQTAKSTQPLDLPLNLDGTWRVRPESLPTAAALSSVFDDSDSSDGKIGLPATKESP